MKNETSNAEVVPVSTWELDDDQLSPAQHAAVLALLTSPTITSAARVAKVSRSSIHRWLKEPAFRTALREARRLAVRQVSAYVQSVSSLAAATLRKVMKDNEATAASRVSAARTTLELTYHLIEADEVAERLALLENLKAGMENNPGHGW